jgi:precorrin-2/cobalt-factor-2 C20-methyltransferase
LKRIPKNPENGSEELKTKERSMAKHYGTLTGASLGPGDPGLITRSAWDALHSGARWVYPVKRAGEESYALAIVRRAGLAVPADAVELVFPMTRDARALADAWAVAATKVAELLIEGKDLVFLVEGDASTFATFGHLARVVQEHLPDAKVTTIPGVSSFAAAAASSGRSLAEEDETLAVVPAAYGIRVIDRMLDEFDSLILLKIKPMLDEIVDLIDARGLLNESCFIEKVGAPDERIVRDVSTLRGTSVNYLSLMLVRNPERRRRQGRSER